MSINFFLRPLEGNKKKMEAKPDTWRGFKQSCISQRMNTTSFYIWFISVWHLSQNPQNIVFLFNESLLHYLLAYECYMHFEDSNRRPDRFICILLVTDKRSFKESWVLWKIENWKKCKGNVQQMVRNALKLWD